jgi:beta-xylosidase
MKLAIILFAFVSCAWGAVPDRVWPGIEVTPVLDVPIRDAAITRASDGTYYLCGTLAAEPGNAVPDFENSRQIKLWKSGDLETWSEIGVVWDLQAPRSGNWHWTSYWRVPLEAQYRPPVRGIVAPELHHIKDGWYLCFSMNGQGTGLLKSQSGKPEGPYVEVGQITTKGGDPSMFWDDPASGGDDSVYWLFDGGWIKDFFEPRIERIFTNGEGGCADEFDEWVYSCLFGKFVVQNLDCSDFPA